MAGVATNAGGLRLCARGFRGEVRFVFVDGNTIIAINTDLDSTAEMQIQLTGLIDLQREDFIL